MKGNEMRQIEPDELEQVNGGTSWQELTTFLQRFQLETQLKSYETPSPNVY